MTREGAGGTRSYEFARRFVERGHGVRMVTAGESGDRWTASRWWACAAPTPTTCAPPACRTWAAWRPSPASPPAPRVAALRGPRPDVIYATSPPLTMALPALAAALRWRAPLVFEVRDLWPEAPIQMGALRNPLARRLARALERFVYARSTRLIALSPGIQAALPPGRTDAGAERGRPRPVRPRTPGRPLPGGLLRRDGRGERPHRRSWRPRGSSRTCAFVLMGDGKRRAELERAAPPNVQLPKRQQD